MDDEQTGPGEAGQHPRAEPSVSLADAAIAAAIGRAAAKGRPADRSPTLEQLLAAFGEGEPTREARERAAAALRLAGVEVSPEIATAAPGQRLALTATGAATPASSRPKVLTAFYALLALAVIFGTAFAVSQLLGDGGERASNALDETTPFTISQETTQAATETTSSTEEPATTETTPAEQPKKDEAEEKRRRERELAKRPMTVRIDAGTRGTYLCVENGDGDTLFKGTLAGRKTFKEQRLKLNIGLATTSVTVNGKPLEISGSPSGFDISRKEIKSLPDGQRPSCT